jgi:hypothetical protein
MSRPSSQRKKKPLDPLLSEMKNLTKEQLKKKKAQQEEERIAVLLGVVSNFLKRKN